MKSGRPQSGLFAHPGRRPDELLRLAACLDPNTQLIVVGHEPTLGLWSQR
jgi:phosphohistidine phosphatase SixA